MVMHDEIVAMCRPLIDRGTKPTLPEVRPIVRAWYAIPGNEAGGYDLHCILDDGNRELEFLVDCVLDEQRSQAARMIAAVLILLSPSQRRRL